MSFDYFRDIMRIRMKLMKSAVLCAAIFVMTGCNFVEYKSQDIGDRITKMLSKELSSDIILPKANDVSLRIVPNNLLIKLVPNSYHNAEMKLYGTAELDKDPYSLQSEFIAKINFRLAVNQESNRVVVKDAVLAELALPKMHDLIRGEVLLAAPLSINNMLKSEFNGKAVFDLNQKVREALTDYDGNFDPHDIELKENIESSSDGETLTINFIKKI